MSEYCTRKVGKRTVRFDAVDEFTKLTIEEEGRKDTRLYAYGWVIWKRGYYWFMDWYLPDRDEHRRRSKTQGGAMAYCRTNPAPGCSDLVRPSQPIYQAFRA